MLWLRCASGRKPSVGAVESVDSWVELVAHSGLVFGTSRRHDGQNSNRGRPRLLAGRGIVARDSVKWPGAALRTVGQGFTYFDVAFVVGHVVHLENERLGRKRYPRSSGPSIRCDSARSWCRRDHVYPPSVQRRILGPRRRRHQPVHAIPLSVSMPPCRRESLSPRSSMTRSFGSRPTGVTWAPPAGHDEDAWPVVNVLGASMAGAVGF